MALVSITPAESEIAPEIAQLGVPSDRVIAELTGGLVRIIRRVEIYESDGETKWDIPYWDRRLSQGSITVDRDRDERRACDFMLDNTDRRLKNDPYDGFWYVKIL